MELSGDPLRLGVVCGDGVPASGLVTSLRNVAQLGWDMGALTVPVHADMGYSWRPDKKSYYPDGGTAPAAPDWLRTSSMRLPTGQDEWAEDLLRVRESVARYDTLSDRQIAALRMSINYMAGHYSAYFHSWLASTKPDVVIGMNLTLPDAVPVTVGLYRALTDYFGEQHAGTYVDWAHDLPGSYAVTDGGERVYPPSINPLIPLPPDAPWVRWGAVSPALVDEANRYGSGARCVLLPNLLPRIPDGLDQPHREWLHHHNPAGRPIIAAPVRIFPVKGIDLSIRFLAALKRAATRRGEPVPMLAVFGSLDEHPEYANQLQALTSQLGLWPDVIWCDGVPLTTTYKSDMPSLDEIGMLRVARATGGGVAFTPSVPDVESVGLGAALAARAGVPLVGSEYNAFHEVYNSGPEPYTSVNIGTGLGDLTPSADRFMDLLTAARTGNAAWRSALATNRGIVNTHFPDAPWREMWADLVSARH